MVTLYGSLGDPAERRSERPTKPNRLASVFRPTRSVAVSHAWGVGRSGHCKIASDGGCKDLSANTRPVAARKGPEEVANADEEQSKSSQR